MWNEGFERTQIVESQLLQAILHQSIRRTEHWRPAVERRQARNIKMIQVPVGDDNAPEFRQVIQMHIAAGAGNDRAFFKRIEQDWIG
jgi:hypothetical protein